MNLYILKLGGSVITDKKGNNLSVKRKKLDSLAKIISVALKKEKFKLIIIHGAGPFGHKLVTDYGIKNGLKKNADVTGFVKTHNSMETLNKIVIESLLSKGVNAMTIQPSACLIHNNKKIEKFDTSIIEKLLALGIVPVLYGDVVFDKKIKGSVVSGDAIIAYLAKKLNARKVLLGTDVDGIFDSNPKKNKNAKLIEKINNKNIKELIKKAEESSSVDVTSGMKGKLLEIKNNIKGKKVYIFNLEKEKNLSDLLSNKKAKCTELLF